MCWKDYFILCIVFFFFQAEDGIRDADVTGVQTCALPISRVSSRSSGWRRAASNATTPSRPTRSPCASGARAPLRSEERRVGKECSCGWLRQQLKKKQIDALACSVPGVLTNMNELHDR